MTVTVLPRGAAAHDTTRTRWTPQRAGILNVWRYYDEVFEFHSGRLLLRGPNGSGKSKALELLLPFLFDASLRANRLSTFGTSERTMHWNLMGDGARGSTRVGYVWLEFAAGPAADPDRSWFTCGARLQASAHTTTAHADYFTLDRPVPDGGFTTDTAEPLGRAALAELLAGHGAVHDSATSYRAAIRERLFAGMSEARYEALILALLQLRTPKLSQRLDPALLSSLLSRALPPLGDTEISELAEGFERLDRQREELGRLDEEVAAADRLAAHQQRYARRVLREAAATLISATSDLDGVTRTVRTSQASLDEARGENAALLESLAAETAQVEAIETDIETLRGRHEYEDGAALVEKLDGLRRQAATADTRAAGSRQAADRASGNARDDIATADSEQAAVAPLETRVARLDGDCAGSATRVALTTAHAELVTLAPTDRDRALGVLDAAVASRLAQIERVRDALRAHQRAVEQRTMVEGQLDAARAELDEASTEQAGSAEELAAELELRAIRLREWAAGGQELRFSDPDAVAALTDAEPALSALVERVAAAARDELSAGRAAARHRLDVGTTERQLLADELAGVRAHRDQPPAPPPTRTLDRTALAGAPLWRLVDFAAEAPGPTRAAVEAALQASGLLDAWVLPDGTARIEGHDVFADPDLPRPARGSSLAEVLRPEPNGPVPADRVWALLRGVAYGARLPDEHQAAVGADGSWRLAALTGTWAKPEPDYIGATARARARARRIAELEASITGVDADLERVRDELQTLARRADALATELAARPDRDALDAARSAHDRAEQRVGLADRAVGQWVDQLAVATGTVRGRARALTAIAAESGLPTREDDLVGLQRAVDSFRSAANRWLSGCADLLAARDRATAAQAAADRSVEQAAERDRLAQADEQQARAVARAVRTTEASVDTAYHEIVAELKRLRTRQGDAKRTAEATDRAQRAVELRIAGLAERVRNEEERRDAAVAARDAAGTRFRSLGTGLLPADAGIQFDLTGADGVRSTLDAARATAVKWPEILFGRRNIDDAFARLAEQLHVSRDSLGTRADLVLEPDGDVQILTAMVGGIRLGAVALRERIAEEARRSRDDITAAERELFDTTLTGDTRRHLADRIRQARELVDRMNERLEAVRTASNVAVQLVWQVDPELPPAAQTARELLLRNPARLSDEDRDALHRFFRGRIEHARAQGDTTSWEQQLAEVFDYTQWHRFVVRLDRGDGEGWQLLTKRLHGALSGGEKAIALHLPLFAAVAAHYQAVPDAPRVILLDEVFVGVDTTNRGQVFALLASLDLDLMLTSDHEWGAYAELDGIAVHALTTGDDGDDAVTTTRFVWDGEAWLDDLDHREQGPVR